MISRKQLFIKDPSANTIVNQGGGIYSIMGWSFKPDHINLCAIRCSTSCTPSVFTLEFNDVDFGDCNACAKTVGFVMQLRRNSDFDITSYLMYNTRLLLTYDVQASGTVTGTQLAQYFEDRLTQGLVFPDTHDNFLVTVVRAGNVLTITLPCPYKFVEDRIFLHTVNLAPGEAPVATTVTAGNLDFLTREQMLQQYPLHYDFVPGQDAPFTFFSSCESICVLNLRACIPACDLDLLGLNASTDEYRGNFIVELEIFINASATGYGAFVAALQALAPVCGTVTPRPIGPDQELWAQTNPVTLGETTVLLSAVTKPVFDGSVRVRIEITYPSPTPVDAFDIYVPYADTTTAAGLAAIINSLSVEIPGITATVVGVDVKVTGLGTATDFSIAVYSS